MNEFVNGSHLDFGEWAAVSERDPAAFESLRREAIERMIGRAPTRFEPRLRGLQWRIDQSCARTQDADEAGLHIVSEMWDKVVGPRGLLDALDALSTAQASRPQSKRSATIVPFPTRTARPDPGPQASS